MYREQLRKDVRSAINCYLKENEQRVLKETYFNGNTLRKAGENMGVSKQKEAQLQTAAIRHLRCKAIKLLEYRQQTEGILYRDTLTGFKISGVS